MRLSSNHKSGVLPRSKPTIVMAGAAREYRMDPASKVHSSVGMGNFVQKTMLVLMVLMVLGLETQ